ncbi:MAG: hypothetical protein WCK54_15940 [Desulfuromonadales bacterium]
MPLPEKKIFYTIAEIADSWKVPSRIVDAPIPLPKKGLSFTIAEVATRWNVHSKTIEDYLLTGKLISSVYVPSNTLCRNTMIFNSEGWRWGDYSEFIYYSELSDSNSTKTGWGVFRLFYSYIQWEKNGKVNLNDDKWYFTMPGKNWYFGFDEPYVLNRCDVVITLQEIERFETEYSISINTETQELSNNVTVKRPAQQDPVKTVDVKKGGRSKVMLTESVEHAFLKLLKEGNTEVLRSRKIREFLERLKEMATEGNPKEDQYVLERIKSIKVPKFGKCTITMQSYETQKGTRKTTTISKPYDSGRVSQILSELRKNNIF